MLFKWCIHVSKRPRSIPLVSIAKSASEGTGIGELSPVLRVLCLGAIVDDAKSIVSKLSAFTTDQGQPR